MRSFLILILLTQIASVALAHDLSPAERVLISKVADKAVNNWSGDSCASPSLNSLESLSESEDYELMTLMSQGPDSLIMDCYDLTILNMSYTDFVRIPLRGVKIDNLVYQLSLRSLDARRASIRVTGGRLAMTKSDVRNADLNPETKEIDFSGVDLRNARIVTSQAPRKLSITDSDLRGANMTEVATLSTIPTLSFKNTKIDMTTKFRDAASRSAVLAAGAIDCAATDCSDGK